MTKLHERLGKPPSCPQSRTTNHDLPFSWRVYIANACNTSNKCASQTILVHANRQVTLHAQIDALQAEKTALQRQLDEASYASGKSALEYADARRKIEQLEKEAREAEMVRRKLHNMVQELKGNIRVFCRARPVLSHDLVAPVIPGLRRSGSSADGADISFPDQMDHREIVISSTSSSATEQERKELHSFAFDRVGCNMFQRYSFAC